MAILEANDRTFDEMIQSGVAIVDFSATHCGPCRALWPRLVKLESEMPFINLIHINVDQAPGLAERYHISALPTIYLCKEGEMREVSNGQDVDVLREQLGELLYE